VNNKLEQAFEKRPLYTVPIPARDEEKTIAATVNAALNIDWDNFM
jgi:cellulose synthase/poly-beta-1,6-N-acetylglucosamine synthase-like glycosyltransferase